MSQSAVVFLLVFLTATIGACVYSNEEPYAGPEAPASQHTFVAAVDCYSCISCPRVANANLTTTKTCPHSFDILDVKKCVKYAEKYSGKAISWVIKGCMSDKGPCEDLKKADRYNSAIEQDYCTECEGDRCNGVSSSLSEMFFAYFAVIIVPIFGKYILS